MSQILIQNSEFGYFEMQSTQDSKESQKKNTEKQQQKNILSQSSFQNFSMSPKWMERQRNGESTQYKGEVLLPQCFCCIIISINSGFANLLKYRTPVGISSFGFTLSKSAKHLLASYKN